MRVHPKWFLPMPRWYQDWAYRDDGRISAEPPFTVDPNKPEPRICRHCLNWFQPKNARGEDREYCYQSECYAEARRVYFRERNARRKGGAK